MKLLRKLFLINSFLMIFLSQGLPQNYSVTGYVIDSVTSEPLPFVNILVNDGLKGGMTDINGYFKLVINEPITRLRLSYVGYKPLSFEIKDQSFLYITLVEKFTPLSEVVIVAGENPAFRIIRNVLKNSSINNPKLLSNFKFTSYDKMVYRVKVDSVDGKRKLAKGDSIMLKAGRIMKKQHIFLMENIAEQQYIYPERNYNKVIATRASGLEDPSFFFLLSQSQPASFYDEVIKLGSKSYINPISPEFDKLYSFMIRDTLLSEYTSDTTFIISFEKKKGRTFDALKGLLYITTNKWAVTNVLAEPEEVADGLGYRIQQQYELIDSTWWFPVQLNTEITFYNYFLKPFIPVGTGKSFRSDIVINSAENNNVLDNVEVDVLPEAHLRDELFWRSHRTDSLNHFDIKTYSFFDSLLHAGKLNIVQQISHLLKGYLPVGVFDLDIKETNKFNKYEKIYLGIGLYTNEMVTRAGSIGGYIGYGFGDKEMKYGGKLKVNLKKYNAMYLRFAYDHHIEESGSMKFLIEDQLQTLFTNYQKSNSFNFDRVTSYDASFTFKHLKYFTTQINVTKAEKKALHELERFYNPEGLLIEKTTNHFGYISLSTRFAFREKYVRSENSDMSIGSDYPVLHLQYTSARKGLFDGNYSFDKFYINIRYSKFFKRLGKTTYNLQGGIVTSRVPYSELFSDFGSGYNFLSIVKKEDFITMDPSEFTNDRYFALCVSHNFGKIFFNSRIFQPEFSMVVNTALGALANNPEMELMGLKSFEHGYYETGLIVDHFFKNTFSTLGIGLFSRLGPYSHENDLSNLKVRLLFNFY